MGITRQQALDCFASDDLIGLGMEADAVRERLHPEGVVGYTLAATLPAVVDAEALYTQAVALAADGATGLTLVAGPAWTQAAGSSLRGPSLLEYAALLEGLKRRLPELSLRGLSATEVLALASAAGESVADALARLRDAGLDCLASYAVILDDEVRARVTPEKCGAAEWVAVHRAAHTLGLRSEATMIFGVGESPAQRVAHLELLRSVQAETGGFTSFTPLAWQPEAVSGGRALDGPTAVEYLKTLAISRLVLEGIEHLQGSWQTQGLKVLQLALGFGADDAGVLDLTEPAGVSEEELRRIVRDAGFRPMQRDAAYRTVFLG